MIKKLCSLVLMFTMLALSTGCGGGVVLAAPAPVAFPPAQPLTCTGDPQVGGGQMCDQSDGKTLYWHDQYSLAIRPDGHGTFQIGTETGIGKEGTYMRTFAFPQRVKLAEVHYTMVFDSWCDGNGMVSVIKSSNMDDDVIENLVGGKDYTFFGGRADRQIVPLTQIVYPERVPVNNILIYINNDLCAVSTVHWLITGSF